LRFLDGLGHSVDFVDVEVVHQIWGHEGLLVLLLHRLRLRIFFVHTMVHKDVVGILVHGSLELLRNLRFWYNATQFLFGFHDFFLHFNYVGTK
jgi:hypothetical protein